MSVHIRKRTTRPLLPSAPDECREVQEVAAELYHALKQLQAAAFPFIPSPMTTNGEWLSDAVNRSDAAIAQAAAVLAPLGAIEPEPPDVPDFGEAPSERTEEPPPSLEWLIEKDCNCAECRWLREQCK